MGCNPVILGVSGVNAPASGRKRDGLSARLVGASMVGHEERGESRVESGEPESVGLDTRLRRRPPERVAPTPVRFWLGH